MTPSQTLEKDGHSGMTRGSSAPSSNRVCDRGRTCIECLGVSRQTGDADLSVPERWRARWKEVIADLGNPAPRGQASFVQYAAPTCGACPVDLMVVEDETFDYVNK